jgi:D-alanyl-D-alanine dipeptidase
MKPYHQIPIHECGEALVAIPPEIFSLVSPHAYEKVGAPYGDKSPFYLRQSVCDRLLTAQTRLQQTYPGWKLQVFDAYRPIAVQQYMVDYTFAEEVRNRGLELERLTELQRQEILELVYQFWAVPNPEPTMPPPHSTGAAVDVTLVDELGQVVDMGSPIDELSPRSYPDHFAGSQDAKEQAFDHHRQLLRHVMTTAGFADHRHEWWHFSFGDQMWAWWINGAQVAGECARYGRI